MASVLAIISKALFEKLAPGARPGVVVETDRYVSNHKAFAQLGKGDAIFLVTVRPPRDTLWLVAILEAPKRAGDAWVAAPNRARIRDITGFVKAPRGKLAMSLQSPRVLAATDVPTLRVGKSTADGKPPEVAHALAKLKTKRRSADLDDVVEAALEAVAYPAYDQILPIADTLTPLQRALALALADRPEISTGRWAFPDDGYPWKRWLGLAGSGVLERAVGGAPLWRAMLKSKAAARARFDALSLADKLEVFADAYLGAYGIPKPRHWNFARAIGNKLGAWGAREADRAATLVPGDREQIAMYEEHATAILLALVRGGRTIAPRWDELVAACIPHALASEVLRAVPEPRRGKAIARWIRTTHSDTSFPRGAALLREFPSRDAVRGILAYRESAEDVPVADLAKIRDPAVQRELAAWSRKHAKAGAQLRAALVAAPKLKREREWSANRLADLSKMQRAQLAEMARTYDGKDLPLSKRFGDGPDAHAGSLVIRELVDAATGKRVYDAFSWLADDGVVFVANTTDVVAQLIQHGVHCDDPGLEAALDKVLG